MCFVAEGISLMHHKERHSHPLDGTAQELPRFYAQRQAVALLKALEPEIHMGQKSYQVIVGFGEKMDLKDSWDSWNFEIIEERIEKFMSQNCLNSFLFFCHKF